MCLRTPAQPILILVWLFALLIFYVETDIYEMFCYKYVLVRPPGLNSTAEVADFCVILVAEIKKHVFQPVIRLEVTFGKEKCF
jgi:hypothetical protein